jgi:hypothetical protein
MSADASNLSPSGTLTFSDGKPNFFLLKPVIFVLDNRQYPTQELA